MLCVAQPIVLLLGKHFFLPSDVLGTWMGCMLTKTGPQWSVMNITLMWCREPEKTEIIKLSKVFGNALEKHTNALLRWFWKNLYGEYDIYFKISENFIFQRKSVEQSMSGVTLSTVQLPFSHFFSSSLFKPSQSLIR